MQVLPAPPGSHLGQEQRAFKVSFFAALRPPAQNWKHQLPYAPPPPHTHTLLTHNPINLATQEGQFPLDVVFMLPF